MGSGHLSASAWGPRRTPTVLAHSFSVTGPGRSLAWLCSNRDLGDPPAQTTASSGFGCLLRFDPGSFQWTPVRVLPKNSLAAPRPSSSRPCGSACPVLHRRNPFLRAHKRALYRRFDPRFFAGLRAAPHCLDICALSMQFCSSALKAKP